MSADRSELFFLLPADDKILNLLILQELEDQK